jgi:hypothetical protein
VRGRPVRETLIERAPTPGPTWYDLAVTPEGYYRDDEQVEQGIVMVVQKDDGTQELQEPAAFARKYGFKNEPDKVRLGE